MHPKILQISFTVSASLLRLRVRPIMCHSCRFVWEMEEYSCRFVRKKVKYSCRFM